ncbi:MAG: hypothetical protein H6R26_2092 [Proteobacteria bacterium]|nr:hypothetical protein [Pseudomonadota bacterium]
MNFDFKRMLKKELNVGLKDQKIRYGAGAALILLSVVMGNVPLLLLGAVLVATGFMRWCPAYSGMNKSTVDPNEPPPVSAGGHGEAEH